jgi:hypothetical protein
MWVGVAVLVVGALIAALLPFSTRQSALEHAAIERSGGQELAPAAELVAVA